MLKPSLLSLTVLLLSSVCVESSCSSGYTQPFGSEDCGAGWGGMNTVIAAAMNACPTHGAMQTCCTQHDRCYNDPVGVKAICDDLFERCIRSNTGGHWACNQFANLVEPLLNNSASQAAYTSTTNTGQRNTNKESLCCEMMPPGCTQTNRTSCTCAAGTVNTCQLYQKEDLWGSTSWRPVLFATPRTALALWDPCIPSKASPWTTTGAPHWLEAGAAYWSPNKEYALVAHSDGLVDLYKLSGGRATTLWSIPQGRQRGVADTAARRVLFGHGGNFQVKKQRDNGSWEIVWSSNTSSLNATKLAVQNDGNVVFRTATGQPVASTVTWGGKVSPMNPGELFYPSSSSLVEGEEEPQAFAVGTAVETTELQDYGKKKKAASSSSFVAPVIVGVVVVVVVIVAIVVVAKNRGGRSASESKEEMT